MADVRSVEAAKYNILLAGALKKERLFESPDWIEFAKSGAHRERPINEEDFWFKRAASVLRQIYIREIVGVGRLRTRYGGNKDRGMKPKRFAKGSGKIIRLILQQGEKAGLIEKAEGKKKGRKLAAKGREFLEKVADEAGKGGKE